MEDLEKRYFDWLVGKISNKQYQASHYIKLLSYLHVRRFVYILPMDGNRSEDGIDLRYRGFAYECGISYHEIARYLDIRDCSVLEMMVALAIRGEDIVGDPEIGDRTAEWFWWMIDSLGLVGMTDEYFDDIFTERAVDNFINHDYRENGKGGLFIVNDPPYDMRDAEIWNQMCWFLSEHA